MTHLIDTCILVRLANAADPMLPVATNAIVELHRRGETLFLTPQVIVEFRNVATRPVTQNGLGLSATGTDAICAAFELKFPMLPETPEIYLAWKGMVSSMGIIGKQVHDVRLVAVCHVHAIAGVLTFNVGHFHRFAAYGAGLVIVDPAKV
jgi:predicted nucleic acid-binding protein